MPPSDRAEGHRKRLREKFIRSGFKGFHDYEVVELLLTLGSPRKDCKQQAKEAIARFKTLRGVLEASPEELEQISGIGPHNVFGLKLVREAAREFLKEEIIDRPVYTSASEIFDYLYCSMRDLKKEVFKVIYLNSQNQIIEAEDLVEGTVNAGAVYPREIMSAAIRHGAASLIFVHNHPSGDPKPSASDRALTRDLVYAGCIMQVKILDHIIIGGNRYFSFNGDGLIEEYELDFLNLRARGTAEARQNRYKARLSAPRPPWAENKNIS